MEDDEEKTANEGARSEQETIEDALFECLKKKLDAGTIKSMDARILLEMTDRRSGRVPKGSPIPGLLRKLPFENDDMITK